MRVVFRVDASRELGTGHVMRCLTLARALNHLATVEFVSREHIGNLCGSIEASGYRVHRLPAPPVSQAMHSTGRVRWSAVTPERDLTETIAALTASGGPRPDWLIADHYSIGAAWESAIRPHVERIFVIDDLADRAHDCDMLLDQNFYANAAQRYASHVRTETRCLLGPKFALLRPEFTAANRPESSEQLAERLFVSFGGYDQYSVSLLVVKALSLLGHAAPAADIVASADKALYGALSRVAKHLPSVEVHGHVNNIAQLMIRCTLAVGAGGSSTWERCALGVPTLVVVVAENQRQATQDLASFGAIIDLGDARGVTVQLLANAIAELIADRKRRKSMRAAAMSLVDGRGTCRVVEELTGAMACST